MSGQWELLVGWLAMIVGTAGLAAMAFALWWLRREPLERRLASFMRRRQNGERRKTPAPRTYLPEHADWIVRSGTDRRHGGGRRHGH